MKIKTKKKMYIGELLEYIRKNKLRGRYFRVMGKSRYIKITPGGYIYFDTDFHFRPDDTFTVAVEEELTEDTEIHGATLVYYDESSREVKPFRYADVTSPSLKHIIQLRPGTVALAVFRGKQLIWTKEHGIPESGVLEVSEE